MKLYLVCDEELGNDAVVNPDTCTEIENDEAEIERSHCHFSNVDDFEPAVEVIMNQVEETIYDPKIKTDK